MALQMAFTDESGHDCPKSVWAVVNFQLDVTPNNGQHATFLFHGWKDLDALVNKARTVGYHSYTVSGAWFWLAMTAPPESGKTQLESLTAAVERHAIATKDCTDPARPDQKISWFEDAEQVGLPPCWLTEPDKIVQKTIREVLHPDVAKRIATAAGKLPRVGPAGGSTGIEVDLKSRFLASHLKWLKTTYLPPEPEEESDERPEEVPPPTSPPKRRARKR